MFQVFFIRLIDDWHVEKLSRPAGFQTFDIGNRSLLSYVNASQKTNFPPATNQQNNGKFRMLINALATFKCRASRV